MKVLTELPPPDVSQRSGPRGLALKQMEYAALAMATNLRVDNVFALKSRSEQEAAMPRIEEDFRKLEAQGPDQPQTLRIKAKMQLAKGDTTDAITTLGRAMASMDTRNPIYYEMM
jgi:hypothetical protein